MIYAIPVFFLLIGLELWYAKSKGMTLYRLNDALANISCGIVSQVTGVFFKVIGIILYFFLYNVARIYDVPINVFTIVILFVAIDFLYYWFHRYSHEINAFWGAHVVHHQSEDYNLSVALRQSSFQGFVSSIFYLPLAVIGFDPATFVVINLFQTLYQFWIHTEAIDRMPAWFAYVFNTPSHHRVHHGRNPEYIDRNHGGTLIIFDRMFGTFEPEREPVVYGVTTPLNTFNPIWANFDYYKTIGKEMKPMKFTDKLRLLVEKPGWRPAELGGPHQVPEVDRTAQIKYDPKISNSGEQYVFAQYVVMLLGTVGFLLVAGGAPQAIESVILATLVLFTASNLGAITDKKSWAIPVEFARLLLVPLVLWLTMGHLVGVQIIVGILAVVSVVSVWWLFKTRTVSK
ncbi:MAG: sterol desaturase family protein [Saprospiraceae bacterium]|nr:sterol desaturase family protein [Saprospiraceae bacterium]